MPVNYEIEMKGVLDREHLDQIAALPAIQDRTIGNTTSRTMTTTYFDTPDLALHRQDLSLRVRKMGNTYVQCLKKLDKSLGAMIGRSEWEGRIAGPTPSIDHIDDRMMRDRVSRSGEENLHPVFESVIERHSRKLEFADGTTASLDIDVGEITAGDAAEPVCEFELELISGSLERLLELASTMNQAVPFRLSALSKAARGIALLSKDRPRAQKRAKSRLPKKATVSEALAEALQGAISHLQANEAAALLDDSEGIHQMRIALRRMSAVLGTFRPTFGEADYRWAMGEVKWLRGEFSMARSWDVFINEFLPPVARARSDQGFDVLEALAEASRTAERERTHRAMTSGRYTQFLLRLSTWLHRHLLPDGVPEQAEIEAAGSARALYAKQVAKRLKKVQSVTQNFKGMSDDDRHRLRIAIKKLRYTLDLRSDRLARKKLRAFRKALSRVQAQLGYLNDAIAAEGLVQDLIDASSDKSALTWLKAAGVAIGWHRRDAALCERQLVRDVARLRAAPALWKQK